MYNFTTETQGLNTFRVCEISMETPIDTAGLGMIITNKIPGLCNVSSLQLDNKQFIRYNISSQISLQQFFGEKVDKKSFLTILHNILEIMENMEDYMLEPRMLLLDKAEMYINVSTLQMNLIYYPIVEECAEFDLYTFVKELIMSTQFDTEEKDNYVTVLISYLNHMEQVTISGLKMYVHNLMQTETVLPVIQPVEKPQPAYIPEPIQTITIPVTLENEECAAIEKKEKGKWFSFLSSKKTKEKTVKKESKKEKTKSVKNSRSQEVVAPNGMVIPHMDNVRNSTLPEPPRPQGAPSLHVIQQAGGQQLEIPQPIMQQQKMSQQQNTIQQPIMQQVAVQPMVQVETQQPLIQPSVVNSWTCGETTVLGRGNCGATTVLNEGYNTMQRQRNPYLLRKKTNERIEIDKNIFRIGKERNYVDYCIMDNSAISRTHADIIRKNDEFYIVDNNSLNHTFLNGQQIPSSQMHKLEDFVLIKMADEIFEFTL